MFWFTGLQTEGPQVCFQLHGLPRPSTVRTWAGLRIPKLGKAARLPGPKFDQQASRRCDVSPVDTKPTENHLQGDGGKKNKNKKKILQTYSDGKLPLLTGFSALNLTRRFLGRPVHRTGFSGPSSQHRPGGATGELPPGFHPARATDVLCFIYLFIFFLARLSSRSLNHPRVSGKGFGLHSVHLFFFFQRATKRSLYSNTQ